MAKQNPTPPAAPPRPTSRWLTVLTGVIIGAVWGAIMWAINAWIHGSSNGAVFAYLVLTMAMLGGGVAAFFGAIGVRRSGENIGPGFRRRK
jgi:hypothetical protein